MSRPPSIRLRNVSIRYGKTHLFDDLNFELASGAVTCLLGPSGVGKTTLLRCIAGLDEAAVDGDISASDGISLDNRIAWMAQQDLLLPWINVLENVMLGATLRGDVAHDTRDRARELLQRVELPDTESMMPAELSGGMRQRVALARTLMEDRPVTLMDEPFSSVDAMTRHRLQELASELLHGRTTLLVTHDPIEAIRVGHAIYVMSGRPATTGSPVIPGGTPVRDLQDPGALEGHARLMALLEASGVGA